MAKWVWYKHNDGTLRLKREGDHVDFGMVRKDAGHKYWSAGAWHQSICHLAEIDSITRTEMLLKTSTWWQPGDEIVRYKPPTLLGLLHAAGYTTTNVFISTKSLQTSTVIELKGIREIAAICEKYFAEHGDTATEEEKEMWGNDPQVLPSVQSA